MIQAHAFAAHTNRTRPRRIPYPTMPLVVFVFVCVCSCNAQADLRKFARCVGSAPFFWVSGGKNCYFFGTHTTWQFGSWVVDEADAAEVLIYRGSLVAAALAVAAGATMALLPDATGLDAAPNWAFDAAAAAFFASFGVSVATIHIYMKPMHNFLKVLWAAGAMGAVLVLVASPSHSLVVDSFQVNKHQTAFFFCVCA